MEAVSTFCEIQTSPKKQNPEAVTRVCFSFAAYAKSLIRHLRSCNIVVHPGLSHSEFSSLESSLGFSFPPDLRYILREGLPSGHGFPDWRSLSFDRHSSLHPFFSRGQQPTVPVMVPIYSHFYIPSSPITAGNPVFALSYGRVELFSFDIVGFFEKLEFASGKRPTVSPPWAATGARKIEFWTEAATEGVTFPEKLQWEAVLSGCLKWVVRRLREGGWTEKDVTEMMDTGGCGVDARVEILGEYSGGNGQFVAALVNQLCADLLRGGWGKEDVEELLAWNGIKARRHFTPRVPLLVDERI